MMTMDDSIEETIPIVTIHSPPGDLPSSPTFLVRSSSLVQLTKDPTSIRTAVFQTNDAKTLSRIFSVSTNALNQHQQPTSFGNLSSAHRFSRSEINLHSHVKLRSPLAEDLDYNHLNQKLMETLGFETAANHVDPHNQMALAPVVASTTPPLVSPLTSTSSNERANNSKSIWTRLKRSFCTPSKSAYKQRLNRVLYYIRVFLTHLFSTTGLCFLVVAYSSFGAWIFTRLESGREMEVKNSLVTEREKVATALWDFTAGVKVLYPLNWTAEALMRIQEFEDLVVHAVLNEGYRSSNEAVEQWSFSGALLYSVTVITTIGYGDVTCKTNWGRIATILYAIIGIPITFLCLANLGNLMAKAFRFSYRKICCCECFCPSKSARLRKRASQRSASIKRRKSSRKRRDSCSNEQGLANSGLPTGAAALLLAPPPPTPPTGSSYATTTFFDNGSSNGTGSLAPPAYSGGRHHSIVVLQQHSAGDCQLPTKGMFGAVDLQRSHSLYNRTTSQGPPSPAMTVVTVKSTGDQSTTEVVPRKTLTPFPDDESDLDDFDQEELDAIEDEDRVPILLVFLLVLGYIILGAFMFSIWEKWGPIEGAYFCFTTLTTIGFGDLVPGSAKFSHESDGQVKFIICCAYMMIGLALIAMSFNLVQEEIVIKCRRIARRLGIMPSDKEQKQFANENKRRLKALWSKSEEEKAEIV